MRMRDRYHGSRHLKTDMMTKIQTTHLFPELSRRFVALLESLGPEDWSKRVSPAWTVQDVVAHLIDSSLRRLSAQRDGYTAPGALSTGDYETLLAYLNRLNADWVRAMQRLSPRVLIDLVVTSDKELMELFAGLDPNGPAMWPVAWAGETESRNWFDIGREYTEKWHHIQQIFEATGRPSTILGRELMYPCLDCLMRALPHELTRCRRSAGTAVCVTIAGDAGGAWCAVSDGERWKLVAPRVAKPAAMIEMLEAHAWRVLMMRKNADEILAMYPGIRLSGDRELGVVVLEMVCVMA